MSRNVVVSLLRGGVVVIAVAALACGATAEAAGPDKLHVGLSASFALSAGGSVWVTDHTGNQVVQVDPAAGRVVRRLKVGAYPFGLAYGARSVWVGSRYGNAVTRLDPATGKRKARIGVGGGPYALAYGAGAVWVTNETSGTVSRIGPKRNRVVKTIRVGGGPNGIAVAFGKVWVADYARGRLLRLSPARNRVERAIRIPSADWITPLGGALWVSSESGKVYRVDPATMAVAAKVDVGQNPLASAVVGNRLWVPNIDSGTVSVIDPATSTVTRTEAAGPSPIAVVSAAGAAWVTSELDGDLWRYAP
jgi:YVTN family beta-propeller protein